MAGPDVVVVGDVVVDVRVAAPPLARGGDVRGEVRLVTGGAGANAAVWASAEGARVRLHGRVGDDPAGRIAEEALRARGVDAALSLDAEAPTGALLVLTADDERSMVAHRGAAARLSPDDLPASLEAEAVLVSGYLFFDPGSAAAGLAALERSRAQHVAVDAASWPLLRDYGAARFLEATRPATLLLANRLEAEVLTGRSDEGAAEALASGGRWACVKLGPEGAVLWADGRIHRCRPRPVGDRHAAGAGDALDGALLACLARGAGPAEALEAGCRAGARSAASPDGWPEVHR